MSINGLRIGGHHVGKRPPTWALNLFTICVFLPVALGYVAWGWTRLALSRPVLGGEAK
jgi:hypothetical protein